MKKKFSTFRFACKVVKIVGIGAAIYGLAKPNSAAGEVVYGAIGKGIAYLKTRTDGIGNMTLREVAVKILEFIGRVGQGVADCIEKLHSKDTAEDEEEQEDEEEDAEQA